MTSKMSMDELVEFREETAVRIFFDDLNRRTLFRWLLFLVAGTCIASLTLAIEGPRHLLVIPLLNLIIVRALYFVRERPLVEKPFSPLLIGYLVAQLVLFKAYAFSVDNAYPPSDFFIPAILLPFLLTTAGASIPLCLLWLLAPGRDLTVALLGDESFQIGPGIGYSLVLIVVFLVGRNVRRRRYDRFLPKWRRDHHRQRERVRMRDELDDARRIQLSMLPQSEPDIPWLQVAAISIPASEVGGDYYDYFEVGEGRQAIVIGDVAGHGVASGLLLSGIRSCLYLLQETPIAPSELMAKLDRMVRATTGKRMFITLLYAVFERDTRRLIFSSAGHPALLRYRASTGEVDEYELHSLPLGTALGSEPDQHEITFEPDDIFVFHTDGISETLSGTGKLYGNERLRTRLRDTAHDRSAREIRDTLLGDVWSFKGDGEQTDDITMVVAKIR